MSMQILVLALLVFNLFAGAYLHGKPKEGKWNFFGTLFGTLINLAILYYGGFFNVLLVHIN